MEKAEILAAVISLNQGEVVGKTRLQKILYLLDCCGLSSGFEYEYHYYGPFSGELAQVADEATQLGLLKYDERPGFHSVPYGIYQAKSVPPERLGQMDRSTVEEKLRKMAQYSALELELAASIAYLSAEDSVDNAIEETKARKPAKATAKRIERALGLIDALGLKGKTV